MLPEMVPLKVVALELAIVSVLLLPSETPLVTMMDCDPLMVGVALAMTLMLLLPSVVLVSACNAPPFRLSTLTPNGLVVLFACSVPAVKVTLPV